MGNARTGLAASKPQRYLAAAIIPFVIFAAASLCHFHVQVGGIRFETGTDAEGWSQGLSFHTESQSVMGCQECCLVIGKYYWYVAR